MTTLWPVFSKPRGVKLPTAGVAVVLLAALTAPCPAQTGAVQSLSRTEARDCATAVAGSVSGSTISVVCGIPHKEAAEFMRLAVSGRPGDYAELLRRLDALIPASSQHRADALARFFTILGEADVAPERLTERLVQVAERLRGLETAALTKPGDDPNVSALKAEAQEAIRALDLARADELLAEVDRVQTEALRLQTEALKREADALGRLALNAAETSAQRGQVALARLRYLEAAQHFATAASRVLNVPSDPEDKRLDYLQQEANALYQHGLEFGDNAAARSAIERYHHILAITQRERVPLEWAETQNNLGVALWTLGERESGTGRLEEAVAAFRAGLEERTRERVPLEWAMTQNNLAIVLWTLHGRESGTGRLEEAVEAFRTALQEITRERDPLLWAKAQNNLGAALTTLGQREGGTRQLEEAVAAYHAALQEHTRQRFPLEWAKTKINLGVALTSLGERESGTGRTEEAVAAFQEALKELTRERVPLQWAMTQYNLGIALTSLGERESGTGRLEEAVAANRAALSEFARERVPLQWEATQKNLDRALKALADRTKNCGGKP